MRMSVGLGIALLILSGCAGGEEASEADDPSKLSAELEARATEIERKADEAAAAVEREAAQDLAQLQSEAREAETAADDVAADQAVPAP